VRGMLCRHRRRADRSGRTRFGRAPGAVEDAGPAVHRPIHSRIRPRGRADLDGPLVSADYITLVWCMMSAFELASATVTLVAGDTRKRRSGTICCEPGIDRASAGCGGVGTDCTNSQAVQPVPSGSTSAKRRSSRIGPISLEVKQTGERSARKCTCCVRRCGRWNRGMVEMVRHSQTKERANGEHKLRPKPAASPRPYR